MVSLSAANGGRSFRKGRAAFVFVCPGSKISRVFSALWREALVVPLPPEAIVVAATVLSGNEGKLCL